jgi:hypothetical protein
MDDEDLFDWVSDIYESDNLPEQGSQIDLTQYEVTLGSIYKEPTGEEYIDDIEMRKKS